MKKQAIAAAVSVALGISALSVEANTAGLTGVWSGTYIFTMYSTGGTALGNSGVGQAWSWNFDAGTISLSNTTAFFGNVWTAHDVTFADTGTSYGPAGGPGAVNMLFDYQASVDIPVTSDWDVTATGNTATVAVNSAVITAGSPVFPNFQPFFTGTLTQAQVIPVPAAVWLMGSGLVGLVGVARRRRKS